MKAQSETTASCRKKSGSSGRLHPQVNIQQQHEVAVQPVPADRPQVSFTIEEHLRVQREIEKRARRFWFAKGCALKNALDDWLKAEAEVLAEFATMLTQHQEVQSASGATGKKFRETSVSLPAVPYQSANKLNPKLTVAFQHSL